MTEQHYDHYDPMAELVPGPPIAPPQEPQPPAQPDPEQTPAQAREAEADQSMFVGVLAGQNIRVLPMNQWRKSSMQALRYADFDSWATTAVHPEDLPAFNSADPTLAELQTFFTAAMAHNGQPTPGKSGASPLS